MVDSKTVLIRYLFRIANSFAGANLAAVLEISKLLRVCCLTKYEQSLRVWAGNHDLHAPVPTCKMQLKPLTSLRGVEQCELFILKPVVQTSGIKAN